MSDGASELTGTAAIASSVMTTLDAPAESTGGEGPETASKAPFDTHSDVTTGNDPGDETPATASATPEPEPTPGVIKPPLSDAEQLLHDAGFKDSHKDGRVNRIPYPEVVKIIANGISQGKGKFGEQYQNVVRENTEYRGRFEGMQPILSVLDEGPEAALAFFAQKDPRFKAFLEQKQAPPPQAVIAEMPAPDVPLPNGGSTYSVDGLRKLLAWQDQQTTSRIEARLKPYEENAKQAQQRAQVSEAQERVRGKVQQQIADAQNWEGFKAHEAAILQALQEDTARAKAENRRPTLSLEAAYRQVVIPALKADETKIREKVLADLKNASQGTAVSRSGAESVSATAGQLTTAQIARQQYDKLNRG